MKSNVLSSRALTGIAVVAAAFALPASAQAQIVDPYPAPMSAEEVQALPPEYRTGPVADTYNETTVGPDGVETIVRTRRIETTAYPADYTEQTTHTQGYAPPHGYAQGYAPGAAVFQREEWIAECERRTSGSSGREKGGIIGGLLGAIAGGIVGNEVARAGERLGSTLIGAGVGGLGGLLIGSLIGGGRNDRGEYDCEAALDSYLSQYGQPHARVAVRTIPAPAYAPPAYAAPVHYGYGYAPAYHGYSYSYAPPQQVVYVPIEYQQQQRVIVRETVREELVEVPGAARIMPPPAPQPAQPRYIKGN